VAEDGDGPIFFHCQTVLWFVETIDNSNFLFYGLYKPYNSRNFFLFCGLYKPQKKKKIVLFYGLYKPQKKKKLLLFYGLYKPQNRKICFIVLRFVQTVEQ